MKKVILIRHAESESNIGKVLEHQNTVKITSNGRFQAEELSEILSKPDRVICSKYIRTFETVEPLIDKYPDTEIHVWIETHEFQPVNSKKYSGMTPGEKELLYKVYWNKMDPYFCDGGNAESFVDLVTRTNHAILKLKKLEGINYVISHGNFMRNLLVLLNNFSNFNSLEKTSDLYLQIMKKFIGSYTSGDLPIKNIETFDVTDSVVNYY